MSWSGQFSNVLVAATCAVAACAATYAAYNNENRKRSHACQARSAANDARDEFEVHSDDTLPADRRAAISGGDVQAKQQTLQRPPDTQQHARSTTGTEPWLAHKSLGLMIEDTHRESARQQWQCRFLGILPVATAAIDTASGASAMKNQETAVHVEGPSVLQFHWCQANALLHRKPGMRFRQCRQLSTTSLKNPKGQLTPLEACLADQHQNGPELPRCLQQQVRIQPQPQQQRQQQQAGTQQSDTTTANGVSSLNTNQVRSSTTASLCRCSSDSEAQYPVNEDHHIGQTAVGPECLVPSLTQGPASIDGARRSPASMQPLAGPWLGRRQPPAGIDQQVQTSPRETGSAARLLATQIVQLEQQQQSHHGDLVMEQHLHELSRNLQQGEQLAGALQQQCCRLTAELQRLQQQERAAKAFAALLQVRHDDQLKKLMHMQQHSEQQRVLYTSYQGSAAHRLQSLLAQLQTQQNVTHQQQTAQAAEADAHATLLLRMLQSKKGCAHMNAALPASKGGLKDAVVAHTVEQDQQTIDELIAELEMQLVEILGTRQAAAAPFQNLQLQVKELTAELQNAAKTANAAVADKHNILKAKDELQRKLAGLQRQLAATSADLAAVTSDRLAIAAAKTQLHHHLQALGQQQRFLESSGQKATEAAESNARRAEELQEALGTAEAALIASAAAKQQVVQLQQQLKSAECELSLVLSERRNGLQHVADLQLKLNVSQAQSCHQLRQAARLEEQLQKASDQDSTLQQQLNDATAAQQITLQRVEQMQQEAQAAADQSSQLQQQLSQLQTEHEGSTQEVVLLSQHLQQARVDAIEGKQLLSQVQQQLQAASEQMQQLQKQLITKQHQSNKAQQTQATAEVQVSSVQDEDIAIRQQAVDWQHQHDAVYKAQIAMQCDRDAALDEVAALQQEVADLRQQHAAAEAYTIELHMKLQQSCDRCQESQQKLAAVQEEADMEAHQLIEALTVAQARISGSTQQVMEAQHDVTQLAQVVQLQQQQLTWQQEQMRRLRDFIRQSSVQLQVPEDLAHSVTAAGPRSSPRPSAAKSAELQAAANKPTTLAPPHAQNDQPSTADALQPRRPGQLSRRSSPARSVNRRHLADSHLAAKIAGCQGFVPGSASPTPPGSSRRTDNQTATAAADSRGWPAVLEQHSSCDSLGGAKAPVQPVAETSQELEALRNMVRTIPSRISSPGSINTTSISSSAKQPAVLTRNQSGNRIGPAAPVGSNNVRQGAAAMVHRNTGSSLLQESLTQGLPSNFLKPELRQGSQQSQSAHKATCGNLSRDGIDSASSDSGSEGNSTTWIWPSRQQRQQQQPSGGEKAAGWHNLSRGAGGLLDIKQAGIPGQCKAFQTGRWCES